MAAKMGLVLALDGEQQFKQGLQNAQKQVKLNQQGIKELSAEYKENANSLEFLQKKQELMEQEQAALTKKLVLLRQALKTRQKFTINRNPPWMN